jgi:signal transduction histidine kinase
VTAIGLGWAAFGAAQLHHWLAWPIGLAGSLIGLLAFHRGRVIARRRQHELSQAAATAAVRAREHDLLRGLAGTLLTFRSTDELFQQVARVARRLVVGDAAAVLIRSGEGQFLRIAAADGTMAPGAGRLVSVEGSLVGPALSNGEPVVVDPIADSGWEPPEGVVARFERMAAVPLSSRGAALGAVAVFRGATAPAFGDLDRESLATLGEQVAVGLDRAAMLDDARRNERILEQTNRELLEATQLKSEFLANMSHELRTPLNAIIGFSDLLASEPDLGETARDYLESISRNGKHLLEMITSVLDASKLEAGRMALRLSQFDLRTIVEAAVQDTESLRTVKRQSCALELDPEPLEVAADQQKIRQVLYNLLSNASKFTDSDGQVAVVATRTTMPLPVLSRDGAVIGLTVRPAVTVTVRDTGIGIAAADQDRLFQPFSQVDSSASRTQSGTGLGLALCKQFVELHGGAIGVESVVGQGSAFWFAIPVER